jgi:hypothetical protein
MRSIGLSILAAIASSTLIGCHAPSPEQRAAATEPVRVQRSTAALAFTPPIALDNPEVATSREERADSAFVGYDSVTYSTVYVYQDDRFRFGDAWHGWDVPSNFERRSIQTMSAVRQR